ncbi:MAG: pyruvate dehydrogenase complex dihydrolipoamide acetyltransferase [Parasphingopyxis sp.]|uniref:pyruvate dehydrogenase complex dihydrolipoamide acetyltransferase n=1 Tax=Parasphingopyxis sp. TaxID=1920299 RepID=UPI0032EE0A7F
MAIELKMPALSPTMEEGTLAKWLVKEGDTIAAGDIMAEIETDKATMEFEAVDEGVLAKILVAEGTDEVAVGTVIAMIAEEGEDADSIEAPSGDAAKAKEQEPATPKAEAEAPEEPNEPEAGKPAPKAAAKSSDPAPDIEAPPAPVKDGERVKASPLARRLAEAKGIDLTTISGSGPKGRIVKADIDGTEAAPAKAAPDKAAAPAPAAFDTDIPHEAEKLSNMRKTIARRLTEAKQTVPHIYLTVDIHLDPLLALRKELNATLEARDIKLSVNDLLIKALAASLMQVPKCNVSISGDQLLTYSRADISVAVSVPNGLITPIIVGADTKSLSAISTEMKELAAKAKDGKLQPHEYQGGTASISNMGMFGIKAFDAVINPPQGMIMAIGAGEQRPHVIDGELQAATVMSVTGSFDHRAIDGADGAQLMQAFKALCENPLGMLA